MKLKLLFNALIALLFLTGCGDTKNTEEKQLATTDTVRIDDGNVAVHEPVSETDPLLGSYVGNFIADIMDEKRSPSYFNRINISLDSIVNGMLYGHSVAAGNIRPFKGTISQKDKIEYLRGYFDTDGGVAKSINVRFYLYFCQKNYHN